MLRGPGARQRQRVVTALALGALLAVTWLAVAPAQVGGPATYVVTSGVSMQPLLQAGDLVLVRPQPSYHVGQVVLYESPVLHRPVLHRIVEVQNGQYYFRGDNNNFVDPGYATRSELVGTLWFSVPALGGVLRWLADPLPAGLLAGLATLAVLRVTTGATSRSRRRRRRHPHPHVLPNALRPT